MIDQNWLFNAGTVPAQIQVNFGGSIIACSTGPNLSPPPSSGTFTTTYCPNNVVMTDPVFASPAIPGQWFCTGFADTQACAASVLASFAPTASGASAYRTWRRPRR